MFPELIIGIVLVLMGGGIIAFRRVAERVIRGGLRRIYGDPIADGAGYAKAALTSLIAVGLVSIAFGVFTIVRSFL